MGEGRGKKGKEGKKGGEEGGKVITGWVKSPRIFCQNGTGIEYG